MKIGNYEIETIVVPGMGTNCYILKYNNDAVLIDAAGDGSILFSKINNNSLNLKSIFITHGHFDHIEALDLLLQKFTNVKIYALDKEKEVIENKEYSLMENELLDKTKNSIMYVKDNDIINELGLDIKIINTPGHTIGSSCFYIKNLNVLFSGDTLFRETYGRTDLPTGNDKSIAKSVAIKLMEFDNDLVVLPGHGFRTTIGYEREHNELVRDYVINWAKNE